VLADCRVTWSGNPKRFQDNLQKIYPFGPTGVIGFAGHIKAAKGILSHIQKESQKKSLPPTAKQIVQDISLWAKEAYSLLPLGDQKDIELMYVASDYGRITLRTNNIIFTENILVQFRSPKFEPIFHQDYISLGYAIEYPEEILKENRKSLLHGTTDPESDSFHAIIAVVSFGEYLSTIGNNQVGGLFAVGIINARGVRWYPYKFSKSDVELRIENNQFIQYDPSAGIKVPLKTIWEFNPNIPDIGNLKFKM
jgi:hypothetical protein